MGFLSGSAGVATNSTTSRARTREQLEEAVPDARNQPRTSVVVIETGYNQYVSGYESWWDVPIAEVSEVEAVNADYPS